MGVDVEFLRGYLEEEFAAIEGTRVHVVLPSTTRRSIDLDQDYDPTANSLHSQRGVRVILQSRDYFFPADWTKGQMELVRTQVREIRRIAGIE